jgi:DNA-binding transcriptional regulator YhcF (GntR family)
MSYQLRINTQGSSTKIQQIVDGIQNDLKKGNLKLQQKLPSITAFSKSLGVSRDTVEKAYNLLKSSGLVISVPGKGIYTANIYPSAKRVLLVINKMSSYKKEIYESFIKQLGNNMIVDIQIHHYDPGIFRQIMGRAEGKYHFYAIMPHFFFDACPESYLPIIKAVEPEELLILDKKIPLQNEFRCVYQDFTNDIREALEDNKKHLDHYSSVQLLFPCESHHPREIIKGVAEFAMHNHKKFKVVSGLEEITLDHGQLYITLTESELAVLIKMIRLTDLEIGKDIGIISFNETVLKELLDITVITTDFNDMGLRAAELLMGRVPLQVRNRFYFIKRGST